MGKKHFITYDLLVHGTVGESIIVSTNGEIFFGTILKCPCFQYCYFSIALPTLQ